MKLTILLDSSNTSLTVGLATNDTLLDSISYEAWQSQSEYMVPELSKLLDKHNVSYQDIESVVVTIGPGSYTGVRIALTIAKVISTAISCPLFALSSLQVLQDENKPSICLINARSNRSYFGVYNGNKVIEKDQIKTNDEVMKYISDNSEYALCGDLKYLNLPSSNPNVALNMTRLKDESNKVKDTLGLKPVYLRD